MSGQKKATRQGGSRESNQHRKYSTTMHALSRPVLQTLAVLVPVVMLAVGGSI